MRLDIKPLSVNKVWRGRRFKTDDYKRYEADVSKLLVGMKIPEGALRINLDFGFSNTQSDIDNPAKPFIDILQKKYIFNDSRIYLLHIKKTIVKKGREYIDFEIKGLEEI